MSQKDSALKISILSRRQKPAKKTHGFWVTIFVNEETSSRNFFLNSESLVNELVLAPYFPNTVDKSGDEKSCSEKCWEKMATNRCKCFNMRENLHLCSKDERQCLESANFREMTRKCEANCPKIRNDGNYLLKAVLKTKNDKNALGETTEIFNEPNENINNNNNNSDNDNMLLVDFTILQKHSFANMNDWAIYMTFFACACLIFYALFAILSCIYDFWMIFTFCNYVRCGGLPNLF